MSLGSIQRKKVCSREFPNYRTWQNETGSVLGSSYLPFEYPFSTLGMGSVRRKDGSAVIELFRFFFFFLIGLILS